MASNSKTEAGKLIRGYMTSTNTSQTAFAEAVGKNAKYVNHLVTGHRRPSPEWVDIVATGLNLSDDERSKLHLAAAKDHGFKIDLS